MTTSPAATDTTRTVRIGRQTFVAAVVAFVVAFVAVGATVPLFNIYRAEDGLTNADISLAIVAYSAATLVTLLVLGRVSNFLGRRLVSIGSLMLLLIGCVLFLYVHESAVLIAARFVMGVGVGLASSTLSAYVIDSAPGRPRWLAGVASSQSVMVGLALGGVGSGALVQFAPWRRSFIFMIIIVLILASIALIALSQETVARRSGVWRSMHPRIHLPARIKPLAAIAMVALLPLWAMGSFYQAFVPAIVEDQLHTTSPLIIGAVFALYMGPGAVGAILSGRFSPAAAQRAGMLVFLVGMAGIIEAIGTGVLGVFFVATVVAGAGQGIAVSATTRALLHGSALDERAPIFSVIYLISYISATVPGLIAGQLSHAFSLPQITLGYGVLGLISTVVTVVTARNPEQDRREGHASNV
jgi:MFS family permease